METPLFAIPDENMLTDSGVYASDDKHAYERIAIVNGWHPDNPRLMARITVRVHRQPSRSLARVDIWQTGRGWVTVTERNPHRFWGKMPGYDRGHGPEAERLTMRLIEDLNNEVAILAEVGSI